MDEQEKQKLKDRLEELQQLEQDFYNECYGPESDIYGTEQTEEWFWTEEGREMLKIIDMLK